MKTVHLVESLSDWGTGRQVQSLAPLLAQRHHAIEVGCLGRTSPGADRLRQAGIAVQVFDWTRPFDLSAGCRLRDWLRSTRPDRLQLWGRWTLRIVALLAPELLERSLACEMLPSSGRLPIWDRWLLQRTRGLILAGESDRHLAEAMGLRCLDVILPAIEPRRDNGLTPLAQRVACFGRLDAEAGFREAIWTMDMLNHLYPDASLAIGGDGPEREKLRSFADVLHKTKEVVFLGPVDAALAEAELCWVPSRTNCGRQAALEAMAAGCPVIAADVPCLREIIVESETGFLVRSGDTVSLGRRTHLLFTQPDLRLRMRQAAHDWVQQSCDPEKVTTRWQELYDRVAA